MWWNSIIYTFIFLVIIMAILTFIVLTQAGSLGLAFMPFIFTTKKGVFPHKLLLTVAMVIISIVAVIALLNIMVPDVLATASNIFLGFTFA